MTPGGQGAPFFRRYGRELVSKRDILLRTVWGATAERLFCLGRQKGAFKSLGLAVCCVIMPDSPDFLMSEVIVPNRYNNATVQRASLDLSIPGLRHSHEKLCISGSKLVLGCWLDAASGTIRLQIRSGKIVSRHEI